MALLSGFKKIEYIETTGTQRIDTNFAPSSKTRIVMDLAISPNQQSEAHLFSATGSYYWVLSVTPKNASWWRTRYGTSSLTTMPASANTLDRIIVDKNRNVTTVNGVTTTLNTQNFSMSRKISLFCRNAQGTYNAYLQAKCYSCQIYEDDVLVRDFVPCINASGEIGMYDQVNSVFYGNAGTGEFIAGPNSINMKVKVAGTWKPVVQMFTKIGGWSLINDVKSKINQNWK